jgi:hypothetical protein
MLGWENPSNILDPLLKHLSPNKNKNKKIHKNIFELIFLGAYFGKEKKTKNRAKEQSH